MSHQNKVDLGPAELYVKWVSFIGLAESVSLENSDEREDVRYELVAIPLTEPSHPDEWLLICDRQSLAETLRTRLKGSPISLSTVGIKNPAIKVRTGSCSENGDFSEISLIAALMHAGFHNISESERPWTQFRKKEQ